MMETYAERLQRKEEKMTNYDMDEIRRRQNLGQTDTIKVSKKDDKVDVEVEMTDEAFLYLAKAAHDRDITFNQLCNEALRSFLETSKPSVLKEY